MKKVIIATVIVLTTGILSSCNRQNSIKTNPNLLLNSFMGYQKNLASGD